MKTEKCRRIFTSSSVVINIAQRERDEMLSAKLWQDACPKSGSRVTRGGIVEPKANVDQEKCLGRKLRYH